MDLINSLDDYLEQNTIEDDLTTKKYRNVIGSNVPDLEVD